MSFNFKSFESIQMQISKIQFDPDIPPAKKRIMIKRLEKQLEKFF